MNREVSLRPMALFRRRCVRRWSVAAWMHMLSVCVFCCLPATSAVCAAAEESSFSSSTDTATAEGLLFEDLLDVEPATAPLTVLLISTGTQDARLLRITFPPPSYIGRELSVNRIRFAGWCLPGSTLTVNGVPVYVFPGGGFAGISPLSPSSVTVLSFRAETPSGVAVHDVVLRRRQAQPPNPQLTPGIVTAVHPDRELLLAPGDVARFSCRASSGARAAWVQLGRDVARIPLEERPESQAGTAVYATEYRIGPEHPAVASTRPVFFIQWKDGWISSATSGNYFGVLREPRTVVTTQDTWVFTEPTGDRLHPYNVSKGVSLSLTGMTGEMCRVSPDMMRTFYIARDRVRFTPEVLRPPRCRLRSAVIQGGARDHLTVSFSFSAVAMYTAELHEDPDALRITFFNAALDTGWTSSRSRDETFGSVEYRETGDGALICTIRPVRGRAVWGYDVRTGNGTITVRLTLDPPRNRGLRGVRIFVDPGHGGADEGAVGPVGLREKDVNLTICRELVRLLMRAGATVVESRSDDTGITWQERFARARDAHPHLYLCMHNNSVPDTTDPLATRGVSVFYQSPRGKRLAECIVREHTALGIPEAYLVWRTPYRGLPSGPVFVVVESAFLSHPADEEVLSDQRAVRRIAHGVARAVRCFIAEERRRRSR